MGFACLLHGFRLNHLQVRDTWLGSGKVGEWNMWKCGKLEGEDMWKIETTIWSLYTRKEIMLVFGFRVALASCSAENPERLP